MRPLQSEGGLLGKPTTEHARLLAYKTWGPPLTDEARDAWQPVLPIAILLTRKRDGTYKCRAVALGNRQHSLMNWKSSLPPIVSQPRSSQVCVCKTTGLALQKMKVLAWGQDNGGVLVSRRRRADSRTPHGHAQAGWEEEHPRATKRKFSTINEPSDIQSITATPQRNSIPKPTNFQQLIRNVGMESSEQTEPA